jgi:hypothetical protein
MKRSGSNLIMGGAGLAAACAVVCCSVPLLALGLPTLALLIGGSTLSIEVGLIAAGVVGMFTGIGVLAWRRRHRTCSKGEGCTCDARAGQPITLLERLPS